MPRLVGRRSNTRANLTVLLLVTAIAAVLLEYLGAINLVPGFGRGERYKPLRSQTSDTQVILYKQP